jgi:GntR family transcriptional regulator, transcriptional repressor for pyruvate dehydrogenase complex
MNKTILTNSQLSWAPVRANSVANQIVVQIREALFDGKVKPGDLLGSEKDLAAQFDVSRISVRDALRTLETMGIVEIRVGAGGGARVAEANLDYFSDALAVQFKLAGITEHEIIELQVAIESAAVSLVAMQRGEDDLKRLSDLLLEAESYLDDPAKFTLSGQQFHLAIVEASGNRALIAQFKTISHVIWAKNSRRAKRGIAEHALQVHQKLYVMIENQDHESAKQLMDAHLKSIRAVAFPDENRKAADGPICC